MTHSSGTSEEEYEPQAYYTHQSAIDDTDGEAQEKPPHHARAGSMTTTHSISSQHLYRRNSHGQVQTLYVSDALVDNPDDPDVIQQEEDGLRLHREVSGMSGRPPSALNEDQVDTQSLYTVSEPSRHTMRRRMGSVVSQLASGSILNGETPDDSDTDIILPPLEEENSTPRPCLLLKIIPCSLTVPKTHCLLSTGP